MPVRQNAITVIRYFVRLNSGLVLGPADKTGGSDNPLLVEPGSVWTRPVYMCASTTRATIQTVRFSFNQTRGSGLKALTVRSITDKQYERKEDMPLWGIETLNMTLSQINPFWGLIDPGLKDAINLTIVRSDHLYIPASFSSIWHHILNTNGGSSFIPGTSAPAAIWESAYSSGSSNTGMQDLSGSTSLALASRWKNMSTTATGTAKIMNLIWTDLAANALVGTRGWLSSENTLPPNLQGSLRKRDVIKAESRNVRVPVYVYQRGVRYRWVYGIPGAICLLLAAVICIAALVAVASGRGSVARVRFYLNRLSAGRLLAALKLGEQEYDSSTEVWLSTDGRRPLSLVSTGYEIVSASDPCLVKTKYECPSY